MLTNQHLCTLSQLIILVDRQTPI